MPVLADTGAAPQHHPPKPRVAFVLVGKVTAVDPVARTFRVDVLAGNRVVKAAIGSNISINTTEKTRYHGRNDPAGVLADFEAITVGSHVNVLGVMKVGARPIVYVAGKVIVNVPVPSQE